MRLQLKLGMCLLVLAAVFVARAEPPPLTLHFDFFYNDIHAAEVRETFTIENGDYVIESHAAAKGLAKILYGDVRRKSVGIFRGGDGGGELHMRQYEEERGRRPLQTAVFDGDNIQLHKGDETRQEPAAAEILLDYLTALYRSYAMQKPTPGKAAVTDGWRLKIYDYTLGEEEDVQTPLGVIRAVPLMRQSPRGRRVFWVAPQMRYIPIKFYIEDKGHVFETILTGVGERGVGGKK